MIFVGIDVASNKHDVTIISDNGEILSSHFTIANDSEGFKKLHKEISSHTESNLDVCIGMEETGIYSNNIADFLFNSGFLVFKENPKLTYHYIKSQSTRSTKTDKIDSYGITRYIMTNYLKLTPYTPSVYNKSEIKSLSRLRAKKLINLSQSKTELKRILMITFPEFVKHFDPFSKWSLQLLSKYKSPEKISKLHIKTILNLIAIRGNRLDKAALLKSIAKDTIGDQSLTNQILVETVIDDILYYQRQIDKLDNEIRQVMHDYPHLTSIPGVGPINGAMILGEIGDINKFSHKSKLLAFEGLDPTIYESGKFKSSRSRISKQGSPILRAALYSVAKVACVGAGKDNKFRRKYNELKLKGKHHNSALCCVAKNISNTVYTILKNEVMYNDTL